MKNADLEKLKKYLDENCFMHEDIVNKVEDFAEDTGLRNFVVDIGTNILSAILGKTPITAEKNLAGDDAAQNQSELDAWIQNQMNKNDSFQKMLHTQLCKKGYADNPSKFYNKACIDRRLFSRIYSEANQSQPDKKTVFKVLIGLELTLQEALKVLGSAGYTFNSHKRFDMIIKYCLVEGIYEPTIIDEYLVSFGEKALYTIE